MLQTSFSGHRARSSHRACEGSLGLVVSSRRYSKRTTRQTGISWLSSEHRSVDTLANPLSMSKYLALFPVDGYQGNLKMGTPPPLPGRKGVNRVLQSLCAGKHVRVVVVIPLRAYPHIGAEALREPSFYRGATI